MMTEDGHKISLGDVLKSSDGYFVVVCKDNSGGYYGSLLCGIAHSCRGIPYSLNNGKRHFYTGIRIGKDQATDLM